MNYTIKLKELEERAMNELFVKVRFNMFYINDLNFFVKSEFCFDVAADLTIELPKYNRIFRIAEVYDKDIYDEEKGEPDYDVYMTSDYERALVEYKSKDDALEDFICAYSIKVFLDVIKNELGEEALDSDCIIKVGHVKKDDIEQIFEKKLKKQKRTDKIINNLKSLKYYHQRELTSDELKAIDEACECIKHFAKKAKKAKNARKN